MRRYRRAGLVPGRAVSRWNTLSPLAGEGRGEGFIMNPLFERDLHISRRFIWQIGDRHRHRRDGEYAGAGWPASAADKPLAIPGLPGLLHFAPPLPQHPFFGVKCGSPGRRGPQRSVTDARPSCSSIRYRGDKPMPVADLPNTPGEIYEDRVQIDS